MKSKYRRNISADRHGAARHGLDVSRSQPARQRSQPRLSPPVLTAMQQELDRSFATLSKADPPAYFISYTLSDRQYADVSGSNGALLSSTEDRGRWLEVQTRVGSYQLDDTHKLPNQQPSWTSPGTSAILDNDIPVLRREIWRETDRQYRAAVASPDQGENEPASAGADGRRRRRRFLARAAANIYRPATWTFTSTASPGKSACGDTRPPSANRPRC